ncbi:MAG: two-component system chemotaxis response regulator CheY [Oleiphilaceae bacterium]|jgi:CheY-like chemotaxis protein
MINKKRVLLIDDSRVSRLMLKAIITNKFIGWDVFEAENAEIALAMCLKDEFDFITLDMNMPGRDGLTVSPELQEACPGAKIALLTANYQERVRTKAEEQGLTFLPKPITEEKILSYFMSACAD